MGLTFLLALIAVPINTIWGTMFALLITRNQFPGKAFLLSVLDLPFSISPVVTGGSASLQWSLPSADRP